MKRKPLFLALAAIVAAGGFWFARSISRSNQSASPEANVALGLKTPAGNLQSDPMIKSTNSRPTLAPPDQTRRFREFTPEQRVEFARKGHGPGG